VVRDFHISGCRLSDELITVTTSRGVDRKARAHVLMHILLPDRLDRHMATVRPVAQNGTRTRRVEQGRLTWPAPDRHWCDDEGRGVRPVVRHTTDESGTILFAESG
jgi:hypothetical protein